MLQNCFGIIYIAINIQNNKVYIGQTITLLKHRIERHFTAALIYNSNTRFAAAIRKYKPHNFKWIILGECLSRDELNEAEESCIEFYNSTNKSYGYNMNNKATFCKGYKHHPDSKLKMSQKAKLHTGKLNNFYGKRHTKETRNRISLSLTGKHQSIESNKKRSIKLKGKIPWNKDCSKDEIDLQKVKYCINNGVTAIKKITKTLNYSYAALQRTIKDNGYKNFTHFKSSI